MLGSNKKKPEAETIHSVDEDSTYVAVRSNLARLRARHQELLRMDKEISQHPEPRLSAQEQVSRAAGRLTVGDQSTAADEAPGATAATVRLERQILAVAITRETQNLGRRQQLASQKILQAERHALIDHARQILSALFALGSLAIADKKLRADMVRRGVDTSEIPLAWLHAPSNMRCWSPYLSQMVRGLETSLDVIAKEIPELAEEVRLLQAEFRDEKAGYDT